MDEKTAPLPPQAQPFPLDANAMLDVAAQQPTLDKLLRETPRKLSEADFAQVVVFEREERARVVAAKQTRADKKAGVPLVSE